MTQSFQLLSNELGQLVLKRPEGEDVVDVRVRRVFPWSSPDRFISIRGSDNKEVLLIEDLQLLEPAAREAVALALGEATFIPRIRGVDRVEVDFGFQQWHVQTDRGGASFRVQEREDIRFLRDGRFILKDADGNLYELPRVEDLDERSRHAIEMLI